MVTVIISVAVVLAQVAILLVAVFVIPAGRRPQTAMAWVVLLAVIPFIGIAVFLLFGRASVGRKRTEEQARVNEAIVSGRPRADSAERAEVATLTDDVQGFARLNAGLSGMPMTFDNRLQLFPDYLDGIEAMTREVAAARRYVHVEFYITAWDDVTAPFYEELVRATERGVEVRLLFDHLGSHGIPVYGELVRKLQATRIQWARMLPLRPLHGEFRRPDLRNHRKILVVDGRVAFVGSQNLIEPCYDKPGNQRRGRAWVELVGRVEGPAVRELNVVFATDWLSETKENLGALVGEVAPPPPRAPAAEQVAMQVVPSGPGFSTENNLRLFNSMLYSAKRRLSITSPYFVPDDSLLYAVTTAAQRGVEVELFVGATADQFMVSHAQRSYYDALLRAGVTIWLYPEPFVLHAKHVSVDDRLGMLGSSNMDMRSFALNYEVVVMFSGEDAMRQLIAVEDRYRALSTRLTLEAWQQRPRTSVWMDNAMRLTATLQ